MKASSQETVIENIVPFYSYECSWQMLTLLQLSGEEGNLLTTAFVTAYGTYLGFSAVSKTPEDECNPFVGESNFTAVVIGIILTILSLFW